MPETAAQQRAELHKTIWKIANYLRGSVDGWDFKQYVLDILFYRFISESVTQFVNENERRNNFTFDYTKLDDAMAERAKTQIVKEKGYFIPLSELFQNVVAKVDKDEDLNQTLESVFSHIEASTMGTDSERDIKGLFQDADVNSNKLGNTLQERNKRLASILKAINGLDFGGFFTENAIDAFGDAYEYLMSMYASSAGKSGGEFFTPQAVSDLVAKLSLDDKIKGVTVYEKTTPRLIQFHTLKNAANPPFLGGFSIFGTVAAEAEQRSCQGDSFFSMLLCNDRKAIVKM